MCFSYCKVYSGQCQTALFLQVGLNSLGFVCFCPALLEQVPVCNNADTNLCIYLTGCCTTSLDLLQHRACKGQLRVSGASTVFGRSRVAAPESPPAASPPLATESRNETGAGARGAGSWLRRALHFGSARAHSELKDESLHKTHPLICSRLKDPEQWSLKPS